MFNTNKYTYKPLPSYLTIDNSSIEGLGLIATKDIPEGIYIGASHLVYYDQVVRTPLGGFINHHRLNNCVLVKDADKYFLKTIKDIVPDEELTLNYEKEELFKKILNSETFI